MRNTLQEDWGLQTWLLGTEHRSDADVQQATVKILEQFSQMQR